MNTEPLHTLDWVDGDETQPDAAHLLWETLTADGDWVGLLSLPELGYVIARRDHSLYGQHTLSPGHLGPDYITLGRLAAGQLAVALITALIGDSDRIIDSLIQEVMARRRTTA